jgi:sarcosine oxidase/L-pipecolate oxidase
MTTPVPDGSSCDISQVIRSHYADPFYAALAKEALQAWRDGPFAHFYHTSSFVLATESQPDAYLEKVKAALRGQGQAVQAFHSTAELQPKFPVLNEIKDNLRG